MRIVLLLILIVSFVSKTNAQEEVLIPYESAPLFESDDVLEIKLKGDIRKLFSDRKEDSEYHPIVFSYEENNERYSINIRVKTRGHFRKMRENCTTPPLLLNFDTIPDFSNNLFVGQNKLKLVTTCVDEKYVVREYLVYKIYQLFTPKSFKVRLVKVSFEDSTRNRTSNARYGILLEDHNKMAKRNNSINHKRLQLAPESINKEMFLTMAVFQYLIGNTDWSIQFLHNIKLLVNTKGTTLVPVPYDFDMSGIVNTPYAVPAAGLQLGTVRDRRYRGYCIDNMNEFQSTFDIFNQLKDQIYSIYYESDLIDKAYKKSTIKYLDRFYNTINKPKLSQRAFQYPCRDGGTGNVIIQGLKKHN